MFCLTFCDFVINKSINSIFDLCFINFKFYVNWFSICQFQSIQIKNNHSTEMLTGSSWFYWLLSTLKSTICNCMANSFLAVFGLSDKNTKLPPPPKKIDLFFKNKYASEYIAPIYRLFLNTMSDYCLNRNCVVIIDFIHI